MPETRSRLRRPTTRPEPTSFASLTSPPATRSGTSSSMLSPERQNGASCRSPSAAACARWTMCANFSGQAPTRFRSTPRQSRHESLRRAGGREFGNQCIVVAINAKQVANRRRRSASIGNAAQTWRNRTGIDAIEYAKEVCRLQVGGNPLNVNGQGRPARRFRYSAYARDFRRCARARDRVRRCRHARSSGRRHPPDGGATAVLAASIFFQFGDHTIGEAKRHMAAERRLRDAVRLAALIKKSSTHFYWRALLQNCCDKPLPYARTETPVPLESVSFPYGTVTRFSSQFSRILYTCV